MTTQKPQNTKGSFVIETPNGRSVVSAQAYMEVAALLDAECVVALADEIKTSFGNNRQRAAVQMTLGWLDECLAHKPERSLVWGAVLGGTDERVLRASAGETC